MPQFKRLKIISAISIALLGSLLLAKEPKIWTGLGPIPVRPYEINSKTSTVSAPNNGEKFSKSYAFAIYSKVQDAKTRRSLEKTQGIRFLGIHDISNGNFIYRVALLRGFEATRRKLKQVTLGFINLEKIYPADKVSRKIFTQSGFGPGEMDKSSGAIFARIDFFEDITRIECKDLLRKHFGPKGWKEDGESYLVNGAPERILALSEIPEVRRVKEMDTIFRPTNDLARELTGVNSIQTIDYLVFPPDTTWMPSDSLTGDSIVIGIDESGIDSTHKDFREQIPCGSPPCPTQLRRSLNSQNWSKSLPPCPQGCIHGTHVAAIAAGNGWLSESAGGARYQWRGVAPKALISRDDKNGDVNNHSHLDGFEGEYSPEWDKETYLHNRSSVSPQNIHVFAAANNGYHREGIEYPPQRGYYSILANAKNVITVGDVHKNDTLRNIHSSMGPTRDGRIKPDIMAPGSEGSNYPGRNQRYSTTVEIDYIRILDSTGAIKYGWEFNTGADGWDLNRALPGLWGSLASNDITAPVYRDSVLRFQATTLFGPWLWSDSIRTIIPMAQHDSLLIRLRVIQPFPSDYSHPAMAGDVYWKRLDSAAYVAGRNSFLYRFNDSNFFQVRHPFQGWSSNDTLMALRLDFLGDPKDHGINSAAADSSLGLPLDYVRMEGTSMAAPHVSGIIALMLDKYNRKYLRPAGLNIHDNAFWNSTAKAILIHSALDLVNPGDPRGLENPDIFNHDPSHGAEVISYPGPDFATGYGLVNAPGAIYFVDTTLFKEDALDNEQEMVYEFNVPPNLKALRVTLAWDDPEGLTVAPLESPKLVNDLDLVVEDPLGQIYRPWVLNAPPQNLPIDSNGSTNFPSDGLDPIDSADIQPAHRGINTLDNVEVVDVQSYSFLPQSKWKIRVKGKTVPVGPQDFSLVADFPITRDSLVQIPNGMNFKYSAGILNSKAPALRASDNTVIFLTGSNDDVIHAYSIGTKSLRWSYTPRLYFEISGPVLAGNRIYFSAGDSLYCLRDDGNHATLLWSRGFTPANDIGHMNPGDINTTHFGGTPFSPALDIAHNRLYTSSWYRSEARVNYISGVCSPDPMCDSVLSNVLVYKLWTCDLDGNIIAQANSFNQISAPASAGPDGAFFVDRPGRIYKLDPEGNFLGSVNYFPPTSSQINRPVVIGPNRKIYVQNDSIIIAVDPLTGDSLACFKSQDKILSNFVIDSHDNIHLLGYVKHPVASTHYIIYEPSGHPILETNLTSGQYPTGELALGAPNLAYFSLNHEMYELDYNSTPSLETARKITAVGNPVRSINIGSHYAVFADGNDLVGYSVTSDGLADGWARTGKDNSNTSFQSVGTPGFTPLQVGSSALITTSSWNSSRSRFSLCGSSSGSGSTADNFGMAYSYASGNFEYTTRINVLDASHPSAKAGLMARTGMGDDAVNGFIWVSSANTAGFSKRSATGGATTTSAALGTFVAENAWVKLRRIGPALYGFISSDGSHYTKLGEVNVGLGNMYLGLTHTSGSITTSGCAEFSSVTTGLANPQALFVVGNTTLSGIDAEIHSRLLNLGYQVTVKSGPASQTSDADNMDIVVISSTVTSGDVGTKFRIVEVPVLNWESGLSDDLGMTGTVSGSDQGTVAGQSQIQIVDPTHPLAAGNTGSETVYSSSNVLSWGKPNVNAAKVATVVGDANKSVLYSYEQGTGMVGIRAPARRVGFFLENASGLQLNVNGKAVFDSAVRWATAPIIPKVLFVTGNAVLTAGDQVIYDNLVGKGFVVTVKTGASAQTADAYGKNLVAISSTVNSTDVGPKFTGVDVPVMNWEPNLSDDLGMTAQGTQQGTASAQTQVKILNAAQPTNARFSQIVKVAASAQILTWGKPNGNAYSVASLVSDTSAKTSFGYERGVGMVSGTAPARRYGIFLNDATPSALTDSGLALWNAAVAWTTGGQTPSAQISTLFGMENLQNWSTSDAALSLSTNKTQGSSAVQVNGSGYMMLTSAPMRTADITGETSKLRLDIFIPGNQPNPYWVGAVQMFAECPSAAAYNVYLGQVELTGLPQNQYSTISFNVPSNVLNILTGNYPDFVFKITLNVNEGTPPTVFDNLRFFP